jgi:hypothetical protein
VGNLPIDGIKHGILTGKSHVSGVESRDTNRLNVVTKAETDGVKFASREHMTPNIVGRKTL